MEEKVRIPWGRIILAVVVLLVLGYVVNLLFFTADTQVNNHIVQPQIRSRLDSDANYRRGIEAQAQGDIATYNRAEAKLPLDTKSLNDWLKANPGPNYSLIQTEQYNNLQAQVQGDQNAITRAATDYNSLVNNPDNAGLLQFDPSLPQSLDPNAIPTPVATP